MYFDLRNVDYPDSINSKKGFSWRYKEVNTKKCNLLCIFRLQLNTVVLNCSSSKHTHQQKKTIRCSTVLYW